jgi:HEAT repeat protein
MADGAERGTARIDPEELLRSALEKIVFFECRVSQLESELQAARTVAERARGDAAGSRRREVELEQAAAAERGARADAEARCDELAERVRLLEAERERLLAGLVERARVGGAPGSDGAPGPDEGGADLAGFIAELRAEIVALRAWKAAAEGQGYRAEIGAAAPAARAGQPPESVPALAGRFEAEGRVGLTSRDADRMKDLLATRADRVLYERSMDDLRAADPRARLRAVRALEALGSKAAAPLLAAALGREEEEGVKAAILSALAHFKEPFAAELAAHALADARPAVRVAALEALAAVAEGAAEERLAGALSDASPLVRRRAALLLGFSPSERAEAALSVALGDPDRGVARAAAAALSGRPTARAQGALARALEHPHESVRRAAAGALARVAGEEIPSDAPAPARRAASRRIAEKLAAMDGAALREAVIAGAAAPPRRIAPPVPCAGGLTIHHNPNPNPNPNAYPVSAARGPCPTTPALRDQAAPVGLGPRATRNDVQAITVHGAPETEDGFGFAFGHVGRSAELVVDHASSAAGDPDLEVALVAEVRAALRGCSAESLAAAVGAQAGTVGATLLNLSARGTLVQRGARWFMA